MNIFQERMIPKLKIILICKEHKFLIARVLPDYFFRKESRCVYGQDILAMDILKRNCWFLRLLLPVFSISKATSGKGRQTGLGIQPLPFLSKCLLFYFESTAYEKGTDSQ